MRRIEVIVSFSIPKSLTKLSRIMIEVTEALTRKVAHLARLELTDPEVKTFTAQLGDILGYVEQLQEVDVSRVEPLSTPIPLETPFREDRVVPFREITEGGYPVPQVL